jgi:hypothetical protein
MQLTLVLCGLFLGINASQMSLEGTVGSQLDSGYTREDGDTFDLSGFASPKNPHVESVRQRGWTTPPSELSFSSNNIRAGSLPDVLRSSGDSLVSNYSPQSVDSGSFSLDSSPVVDEIDFESRLRKKRVQKAKEEYDASKSHHLLSKSRERLGGSAKKEGTL